MRMTNSLNALMALMVSAGLVAGTMPALAQTAAERQAFQAELADPGAEWVVVSHHFRHDVACTTKGCILMGPTENRDACKEWASKYNTVDAYDHARCVDGSGYNAVRY